MVNHNFKGSAGFAKNIIIVFFVGMAIPFVILVFLGVFGVIPPTDATILMKKWNILECDPCTLLISGDKANKILLSMERDANGISRVGITTNRGVSPCLAFTYLPKGKYGKPTAMYGCYNDTSVWGDLNADGVFDQRIDYHRKELEINVEDKWIEGTKIDDDKVRTAEGVYIFDPNVGKWQIIDTDKTQIQNK